MRVQWSALLVACFVLPACAAQAPVLKGPALAAMQRESVDAVDVTLGPVGLGFLRFFSSFGDHDPDSAAAMSLLHGVHRVEVRSYQFAADHSYRQTDLEALRAQFTTPDWQHIIQTRSRSSDGDVDIYCAFKGRTITRVVIIAAQPREFSWINIAGAMSPEQIGALRHGFVSNRSSRSRLATVQ